MATVCPAILAVNENDYQQEMDKVAGFANRIQIDLTDGQFAPSRTISPQQAWWPAGILADFHLMYYQPAGAVQQILGHKPNMIIVHAEAEGNFQVVADLCHRQAVKVGLALLQNTAPEAIIAGLESVDHVLIFSGDLGNYGGQADMSLLKKIETLKSHKSELEIGWDGGINDQNISELILNGVDVLNVGGFIQNAENPAKAYEVLQRIADETGTT